MNALAFNQATFERSGTNAIPCFHCGEPTLTSHDAGQSIEAFCCAGCASAAQWIREANLGDYYRLRSQTAARIDAEADDSSLWDRDDLLTSHVHEVAGLREITVLTDNMRCAACAWLIDRALARLPGVGEISANAATGRIRLRWDPALTKLSVPIARMAALGYRSYLGIGLARERVRREERNRTLLRLGMAGLGAMQAMMFSEALFLDTAGQMPIATRDFLRWVTFLVATPVVWYSGWPFLTGCWRELAQRRLGMDTLIAGSTMLAYTASLIETMRGGAHVWFDAAVMFVFLLLIARSIEQRARLQANAQVDALSRARPELAVRELADGRRESVPISKLKMHDVACVAAGAIVPADGQLLEAAAAFEESLLTGESMPVIKQPGQKIFAGTICRERPVRLHVTEVGTATRLSQITRLVEAAQAHRPIMAQLADRLASKLVFALLACAIATWFFWRWHDPARAFEVTLALLVVSCPCALSLAVPATLAAAHGALARQGVLALKPEALDVLAISTDIVFDKTGTLSDSSPRLGAIQTFSGMEAAYALDLAAALQRDSGHPLAAAFIGNPSRLKVNELEVVIGFGVRGRVDGVLWHLGQAAFAANRPDDQGLWLGRDGQGMARFEINESPRPSAAGALDELRAQGLTLHMSSGDAAQPVASFSSLLGINEAHARQTPEDKLAMVRDLQSRGRVVVMVGDGMNDAPVLAGADVSIAVGAGAALARQAADLVLMREDIGLIPEAINIARRCRTLIRQNLLWALGYNLLAIPIAAVGWVTPWLAATGMALSSLLITLNALRVGRRMRA